MIIKEASLNQVWELRQQVMWPDKELSFVQLPDDSSGYHYGLFTDENRLVSVISLFIEGSRAQFRKFATLAEEQGKGYGSLLLRHTLEEAKRLGAEVIWCNARANKAAFYKKAGLRETGESFRRENMDYVILEKKL